MVPPPPPPLQRNNIFARLSVPQTFVDQVCPLADDAGPYLVQTFSTGGDQAQAAVYVMSRGICPNETANGAALNAFIRECIYNMTARARILE